MRSTDWQLRAACRGSDVELFFSTEQADIREALRICSSCPVRAECFASAMDVQESFGVWGGTPERARRRVFRRAQRERGRRRSDAA